MLAISSTNYHIPCRMVDDDGEVYWKVMHMSGLDSTSTWCLMYTAGSGANRWTFEFDGKSVRPTSRTIRVVQKQCDNEGEGLRAIDRLAPYVSALSLNMKLDMTWDELRSKVER